MLRKLAYRAFTCVIFLPYLACNIFAMASEIMDGWIMRMRRWAFPEKFARLPHEH